MENQIIREQVFDVLFNYVKEYDGIYTESDCATVRDEIMLKLNQSQFTADEAEEHINQEVEKRIAERMPSEILRDAFRVCEWISDWIRRRDEYGKAIYGFEWGKKQEADRYCEWYRSRLTNDSQKTEGGEE